ncbi:hypothetical protein PSR1_00300 [Anaeromyxobacter sp. PSR-1]|nr:hypothetical protein PSR1_00300 [Anaeromyxobacter sp. PSR-1]
MPAKQIFCSSEKGQGIKPGAEFKDSIKNNLNDADTVVALISDNYYNSAFCMCELGGAWLTSKDFIPVLVPPATYSGMKAVLNGLQALKIENEKDLDELRDELIKRLSIESPHGTPRWCERRDDFLGSLDETLKQVSQSPVVPREQLDKVETELKEYVAALKAAKSEIASREALIAKLKAAKDKAEVDAIVFADLGEADAFRSLVSSANTAIERLSPTARAALFSEEIGEDYSPESWDAEVKSALDYKEVKLTNQEDRLRPNHDKPLVKAAAGVIYDLRKWLDSSERSSQFFEWYASKYKGEQPDLRDRSFWDRHLW